MSETNVSYDIEGFYGISKNRDGTVVREWKTWMRDVPESRLDYYRSRRDISAAEALGDWYLYSKTRIVRVTKEEIS